MQTIQDKRPLSPHLQIYKLPLVSMLSITHRFTGVILSFCFLIFLWLLSFCILVSSSVLQDIVKYLYDSPLSYIAFQLISFGFWFSFSYHLLNGIRHMFWDIKLGLSLKVVHITNLMVVFGSVLLTIACFCWQGYYIKLISAIYKLILSS